MSREIKFRAWDKMGNKMLYLDAPEYRSQFSLYFTEGGDAGLSHYNGETEDVESWSPDGIILMQYTGLKDKNGKEIYEGDVIGKEGVYHFIERGWEPMGNKWKIIGEKTKDFTGKGEEKYIAGYELSVVKWQETQTGFYPFADSPENCGHCGGGDYPSNFVVIGNIYENPELLK